MKNYLFVSRMCFDYFHEYEITATDRYITDLVQCTKMGIRFDFKHTLVDDMGDVYVWCMADGKDMPQRFIQFCEIEEEL